MFVLYVVNDNNIVDGRKYQIMHCMFCHTNPIIFNPRRKERKIVISYYKKWNNNIENTCECRSCIACKKLMESTWLKHPATHLCSRVVFLSQKNVSQNYSTWFGEEDEIGVCFAKLENFSFYNI
jgi:hypothetical protein